MTAPFQQHQSPDIFVTETMAELSVRQGRTADAIAIYRRLLQGAEPADERRTHWSARLAVLESGAAGAPRAGVASSSGSDAVPASAEGQPAATEPAASAGGPQADAPLPLPLVVRDPVRSGQIVYAQHTDLIVLAPVNPGAQLLADGNIHIYGRLRGRAVAGVRGAAGAQIFCLRLEAELVGIDAAYLTSEDIPPTLFGYGARVWLDDGRCRVEALPGVVK